MSNLAVQVLGGVVPTGWAVFLLLVAVVAFVLAAFKVQIKPWLDLIGLGLAAFAGVFLWGAIAAIH